ncbi:MAG: KH domain-containing protein [Anaerolineaceae bacterium]|nr:KH domain-containing protein [Anaerolineaceae bacterium]
MDTIEDKKSEVHRVDPNVIEAFRETVLLVRHLVNNPGDVIVDIECKGWTILISLQTHKSDVGQVIGRNAYLIGSIRSILSAIGGKNDTKFIFDYVTEGDNRRAEGKRRSKSWGGLDR